ncbi:MAG: HAD family hydrolase [Deltaproteobacteria bacterium]|nr:HAD family hydrolase [Deltaproteobacteria bacterium]
MVKSIIFDFDGVILESVDVKTEAFRRLFESYPDHVDTIVDYHIRNGGVSRFDKFRYIYANFLKEPLSEEDFDFLCRRFADLVVEEVLKCDFVKGAPEFLENYYRKLSLFVVSGTPQDEIRMIVKRRKLDRYFWNVFGSPEKKETLIKRILKNYTLKPQAVVFVGDSLTDYDGAKGAGIPFIGRVRSRENHVFSGLNTDGIIVDLTELEDALKLDFRKDEELC